METWAASGGGSPATGFDDALIGVVVGGRYEVLDVLGDGGMATVYLAYDEARGCEVAMKVMRASMAKDDAMRRRFRTEAQATMSIIDPHVVEITDFGELEDGTPFYTMERLVGHPLDEYADGEALPPDQAVHIATQICRGLAAAHDKGFIHRDLKPENVFVEVDDALTVKVLDFGVAKVPSSNLTVPGSVFGTPCYMSPEQADPRRAVDLRTDIYSLGIILYELLTGDVPFACGDPMQVMLSHVGQAPDPVRTRNPAVPAALARVVDRCLRKEPDERIPSMRALCEALEASAHIEDDETLPDIEVEETHAPVEVDKTILFDPSKMAITVDDLVAELGLAPIEPDAAELPTLPSSALPSIDPASFASEERLPTPPGPQPWEPAARHSWIWSCLLLLPVILAVAYFALG